MNAISSMSSFSIRAGQTASFGAPQRGGLPQQAAARSSFQAPAAQTAQRSSLGQLQGTARTATYNSSAPVGRGTTGAAGNSSSYCPTCNMAGGRQTSATGAAGQSFGQGGHICVTCGYNR